MVLRWTKQRKKELGMKEMERKKGKSEKKTEGKKRAWEGVCCIERVKGSSYIHIKEVRKCLRGGVQKSTDRETKE